MRPPASRVDLGLLVLRAGMGLTLVVNHGLGKLLGGPERWRRLGAATGTFGIEFAPTFFGFAAMAAEVGGGLLVMLGLLMRPAIGLILATLLTAFAGQVADGAPNWYYPLEVALPFAALLFTGPGAYSLDARLRARARR